MAAMQNGILTKNTPRQLRYSEKVPPTKGPSAVPMAAKPSTTPIARPWRAPVNVPETTAIDTGKMRAAPMPCTTRATISHVSFGAAPHTADSTPNRTSPLTMTRRRPKRSARRPAVTISAPTERM